jgi:hypothetical protein
LFSLPFENLSATRYSEKQIRDSKKRSGFHSPTPSSNNDERRRYDPELDRETLPVGE